MGDVFPHGFVQLLRFSEGVRVVSDVDVLGASIFRQVCCWIGDMSIPIEGLFVHVIG